MSPRLASCVQPHTRGVKVASPIANSPTTTHGIGRFLIDLPEHFQLLPNARIELTFNKETGLKKVNGLVVRASGATPTFATIVANRTNSLRSSYHYGAESKSMLISARRLKDDIASPVLIRSYSDAGLVNAFLSEVLVESGASVTALQRNTYTPTAQISTEASETQLIEIATGLRAVDPAATTAQGVCLGKALFNSTHDGEYVSISFRSTLWPECLFTMTSRSMLNELDGGLLKRVDSGAAMLAKMGFRSNVLRRGVTTLGGSPAEELLETGKDRDKTVRTFMGEVLLKVPATFAKPQLTLVCEMGGQVEYEYVEPKLSDKESVALWDAVRTSVRPRAGAV